MKDKAHDVVKSFSYLSQRPIGELISDLESS